MVDEADPPARMFQEHVQSFLESLALFMMEHVLGFEGLVDGQIDRVIRIGHPSLVQARWLNLRGVHITIDNVIFALFPAIFPFHRRGHPLVVCLAESRRPETSEECETTTRRRAGLVHLRAVVLGVLSLAARRFQCHVLRFEAVLAGELVLASLQDGVRGRLARPLFCEPRALVLASWKTLVGLTWTFPGYCRLVLNSIDTRRASLSGFDLTLRICSWRINANKRKQTWRNTNKQDGISLQLVSFT